ncbi:MAG: ABC transporter permease [Planctomycetaceae bacterium]|jgi:putative ABC transport system permease protein|nr:ABC transporter permease [Planctomycetaceae bacterium]
MPLWKIAYRSIQFRKVSSILTAISMSLGVAIIVTVLVIHGVLSDSFNKGAQGYDLIIAGKGSPLNVVLNTVFYLGDPVGGVPESYLKMFRKGQYSHLIEEAIPVSIGHHFRGATIVGTSPEFFSKLKYFGDKTYIFADGENFRSGADYTAVIGSRAAKKAGLKVGDEFIPEAAQGAETETHHEPFKVVGILNPTGTPNDTAIFVNIDGFYEMHAHHDEPAGHNHDGREHAEEPRKYSVILLMTKQNVVKPEGTGIDPNAPDFDPSKMLAERSYVNIDAMQLPQLLDKTTDVQAVSPVREIAELLSSIVGNIQMVLIFLAVLVVIVAGIGMMTAIYNSMSERKQEIAVMRALGARRLTVMSIILLESILLSLGGGFLGVLLGHLIIGGISPWISEYTGIIVRSWNFQWTETILIPGLILLASLVGFLPALVAYKQDVAASLTP